MLLQKIGCIYAFSLVENRSVRSVQIFGLCISHSTSTKSKNIALNINNREYCAISEHVKTRFFLYDSQPGQAQFFLCKAFPLQITRKCIPFVWSGTKTKFPDRSVVQSSFV